MNFKKVALSAIALAVIPFSASAENTDVQNIYAECGLGAVIFENDIAAAFSNIIWDLGTTAVTSGLSSPGSCSGADVDVAEFISETYINVADETAKGEGDYLNAMLSIAGCEAESKAEVISSIQTSFAQDLSDSSYSEKTHMEKSASYFNIVKDSTAGICDLT